MFDRADREYRSFLRHARKRRRFAAFVVETDAGVPVASGAIWLQEQQPRPELEPGPLPYLMSMFTEPDHRGHGHASEVVRAAVAWCRERGYPRLILHAAPGGRKIYRRVGFRRTWEMVLELGKGPSSRRRRTTRAGR
jgi:GNAT superfamily N-acetyltransferase